MSRDQAQDGHPTRPALQLVRGDATAEELAALVAVLAAAGAASEPAPPPQRSRWAARPHGVRGPLHAGPGAWRASALPR